MKRYAALLGAAALLVSYAVPAFAQSHAVAQKWPQRPLYDNLSIRPAHWSQLAEERAIARMVRRHHLTNVSLRAVEAIAPDGKTYYFAVVKEQGKHGKTLFVVDRKAFLTLARMRKYVKDQSDFELIGASLGFYSGPITVTVSTAANK
jgi:hypothetical protein